MADSGSKSRLQAVAWVPNGPKRDDDRAIKLAATWIRERSAIEGAATLLVTNTMHNIVGISDLQALARGGHATPQGKHRLGLLHE